jgi:hypothetical protein
LNDEESKRIDMERRCNQKTDFYAHASKTNRKRERVNRLRRERESSSDDEDEEHPFAVDTELFIGIQILLLG